MHIIVSLLAFILQCFKLMFANECGYDNCDLGKPGYLNVHLVAHTHDDVGWLKTIDQYYYGYASSYQQAGVQYILDSVIQALLMNTKRKFTYVEMAFFERWWKRQSKAVKHIVKQLVRTGQLEFALGGWSMNDEAVVHYADSVDQLTRGIFFLNETFSDCGRPRTAWQIDTFGHARDQAQIFIDAGFDSVFFQRMDYRERKIRLEKKLMEVLWKPDQLNTPGLFTHMLFQSYCSPPGFCFDSKCNDPPIIDDPSSPDYNVDSRVHEFISYVKMVAENYATNNIFIPMGCDFTFENANQNFVNMDRLIYYVNRQQKTKNSTVNLLYSSPTCYTKAVNNEFLRQKIISYREGDFFPYASDTNSYWTGYFTSRPAIKFFVRQCSSLLVVAEQVHALAPHIGFERENENSPRILSPDDVVDSLRRIMGVLQHHDAITGTEKQHVSNDYIFRLYQAAKRCQNLVATVADYYYPSSTGSFKVCENLNISLCTETTVPGELNATIALYNPLGWPLTSVWLRIPIHVLKRNAQAIEVSLTDAQKGTSLETQLMNIPLNVERIPERIGEKHRANMEILVQVGSSDKPLQPAGFSLFNLNIKKTANTQSEYDSLQSTNSPYSLFVDEKNLPVFTFTSLHREKTTITVEAMYYHAEGNYAQTSGAYLFRPTSIANSFKNIKVHPTIQNGMVQEVLVEFSKWASLTARLYRDNRMEVDWVVGPLPKLSQYVTEVIIRYRVDGDDDIVHSKGVFFTDSLGRHLIRRERNKRPDWGLNSTYKEHKRIEGNYYPIVNRIMLKGRGIHNRGLAIYTDRAQGGSSLKDGELELMVHRATVTDDALGVGEPLVERGAYSGLVVRGTHTLLFGKLTDIENSDARLAQEVSRPVLPLFRSEISHTLQPNLRDILSILFKPLPTGVHLLTFTKWPIDNKDTKTESKNMQILIRLENIQSGSGSIPARVDMNEQFVFGKVVKLTELTLVANQLREEAIRNRLVWPTEEKNYAHIFGKINRSIVTLNPGEIKTMLVEFER